jgi:hypothetical protein
MLGILILVILTILVCYVFILERYIRSLEYQAQWASMDAQAWTRFLSKAAPVIEPSTSLSKLFEAMWPYYISERIKEQMMIVLRAALAELPDRYDTGSGSSWCRTGSSGRRAWQRLFQGLAMLALDLLEWRKVSDPAVLETSWFAARPVLIHC